MPVEYNYATLEQPWQTQSAAAAVTDKDVMVGSCNKSGGDHGFVWRDGTYTPIDSPGSVATGVEFVTPGGILGRDYFDAAEKLYDFRESMGVFTTYT